MNLRTHKARIIASMRSRDPLWYRQQTGQHRPFRRGSQSARDEELFYRQMTEAQQHLNSRLNEVMARMLPSGAKLDFWSLS